MSTSATVLPLYVSFSRPVGSNVPSTAASTSSPRAERFSSGHFAGGTDSTIRSCDSLIQISV